MFTMKARAVSTHSPKTQGIYARDRETFSGTPIESVRAGPSN